MIDIHCHILPGCDDGSAGMAESLTMARMALDSGVTEIVATPHFRGEPQSLQALPKLYSRYHRLTEALQEAELPLGLYPGAEILCLSQTGDMARRHELPTLGETDYVLVEFFFDAPMSSMDRALTDIAQAGYRPVVAHPERYNEIQRNPAAVEGWFRKGCLIQLNKGSILGAFGYQKQMTAEWILSNGLAHMVASDAHGAERRTTDMTQLRAYLMERCPAAYVQVLMDVNPRRLVQGQEMYR